MTTEQEALFKHAESLRPIKDVLDELVKSFKGASYCIFGNSSKEVASYFMGRKKVFEFEKFTEDSDLDALIVTPTHISTPNKIYRFILDKRKRLPDESTIFIIDKKSFESGITNKESRFSAAKLYLQGLWFPEKKPMGIIASKSLGLQYVSRKLDELRTNVLNLRPAKLKENPKEGARLFKENLKTTLRIYENIEVLMKGNTCPKVIPSMAKTGKDIAFVDAAIKNYSFRKTFIEGSSEDKIIDQFLYLKDLAEKAVEVFYQNLDYIQNEFDLKGMALYQKDMSTLRDEIS